MVLKDCANLYTNVQAKNGPGKLFYIKQCVVSMFWVPCFGCVKKTDTLLGWMLES